MPFQHTREPYNLDDGQYGEFADKVKDFLAGENSMPDRPTQFVAEQIIRADAFIALLIEFNAAETNLSNATAVVQAAADGIKAKLRWFKYILPTMIIGADTLVVEFGLDGEMPEDFTKLKNLGDEVWAHWLVRRAEVIFDPMRDDGNLLEGLLTSYDNAISAQNVAQNLYHNKSVAKSDARDSYHELEREIFNWYRAHYPDPKHDYWVKTPWGKSSGGSGCGGEDAWPAKPTAEIKKITFPKLGITAGCAEYTGTKRFDIRIAYAKKNKPVPPMPDYDYVTDVEEPVFLDLEPQVGYVYYEWIRARKGEEVSEWSDVASLEWNG